MKDDDKTISDDITRMANDDEKTAVDPDVVGSGRPGDGDDAQPTVLGGDDITRLAPEPSSTVDENTVAADEATEVGGAEDGTEVGLGSIEGTEVADDATAVVPGAGSVPLTTGPGGTRTQPPVPDTSAELAPGSVLKERFRIEKQLGEGGMGAVYLATDRRKVETRHHDPTLAIKVIRGQFARDSRAFIALQREADKSQRLAHPNIITVYDFDRDGDTFFMTMEALKGGTLSDVITSSAGASEQTLEWISDLAKGVAYAHQRDIVHSDLKPDNVFITDDKRLKILDFGIARALSNVEGRAGSRDEVVGLTPAYASCEMFERADPHPADDVYAIGVIAYQALTGEHPFGRKKSIVAREEGMKPARIKSLSGYQWQAIAKALAFNREDRWQDADEFLRKFTGQGRRVRQLAMALLVAVLSFSAYLALYEGPVGPETPFEELPLALQQEVSGVIAEAHQAKKFGDLNGSLFYLDRAYGLHPRNLEVMDLLDDFLDQVFAAMDSSQMSRAQRLAQVEELLKYESLSQNRRLIKARKELGGG